MPFFVNFGSRPEENPTDAIPPGQCFARACQAWSEAVFFGMVIIRFDDNETEKRALDYLVGRYSFKTWANGDLMLPETALGSLAGQGLTFRVQGPATYEHFLPALRNPAAASV